MESAQLPRSPATPGSRVWEWLDGGAIGLVAGLTAASRLWVLRDTPAARGPHHGGIAGSAQPEGGIPPMTTAQADGVIRQ
jgi:hypothetical protein